MSAHFRLTHAWGSGIRSDSDSSLQVMNAVPDDRYDDREYELGVLTHLASPAIMARLIPDTTIIIKYAKALREWRCRDSGVLLFR